MKFNITQAVLMGLLINDMAPDFSLLDETGVERRLTDYRGKKVILYFYPKDDTPGCTTEACNFRDDYDVYVDEGVIIFGISPDSAVSHQKFKKKFELPFYLLVDEKHLVAEKYFAWGLKKFMGKEYLGIIRTTYLISEEGKIQKIFENVKPTIHSKELILSLHLNK